MAVVGVAVAFGSVIYLASRGLALWLAMLVGTIVVGLLPPMGMESFGAALLEGAFSSLTLQLVVAVAFISGLGKAMKENGDLELMVGSFTSLLRRPKVLAMLLPSLIGTINVPGGAIMSAPMVEESGKALAADRTTQAAINLFFRHIGYLVYPLHTSLILISELLAVPKQAIILYNAVPALVGTAAAYLCFLKGRNGAPAARSKQGFLDDIQRFLLGFSPVLTILGLALLLNVPFYLAAAAGLLVALLRNIQADPWLSGLRQRLKLPVTSWIDYKLALAILTLMLFKSVVEVSGVTGLLADALLRYGIPLPVLVVVLGFLTAYILGTHLPASGLLAPFFAPLFPQAALVPYTSLLLISIMLGYLVSPLHLCLVLTNQYFKVPYNGPLKRLAVPIFAMLGTAVVQVMLFLYL